MFSLSTIFLILFSLWIVCLFFSNIITSIFLIYGFIVSWLIAYLSFRLNIVTKKDRFYYLQIGFYKYIFHKINSHFYKIFRLSLKFINPAYKFKQPVLDYVFLDKRETGEIVLCINLISSLPGSMGIAMKKRYIIVHSLEKEYFSTGEMFNMSNEISTVHDDSLI